MLSLRRPAVCMPLSRRLTVAFVAISRHIGRVAELSVLVSSTFLTLPYAAAIGLRTDALCLCVGLWDPSFCGMLVPFSLPGKKHWC